MWQSNREANTMADTEESLVPRVPEQKSEENHDDSDHMEKASTVPAEAIFYAFPYMDLKDILTMEQVCKVFRDWIHSDALLWKYLHVNHPLSERLTDEALLQLSSRSKGQLQCLSLVDCRMVTGCAVAHVVLSSPKLCKLFIPGCTRITADCILDIVETHGSLKQLKLGGITGLTKDHLERILVKLDISSDVFAASRKPQYYHNSHHVPSWKEERIIDIEICPKCNEVRVVYNCTRAECQQNHLCRACIFCVNRCAGCGICLEADDCEYTICQHDVCLNCWLKLPKCAECNRPGCGRHPNQVIERSESTFVCLECFSKQGE